VFRKVLVANRGEIAVRVIRTLEEMGIGSAAIYSEADRACRHVRYADEAYCIGPPLPSKSYLRIDAIVSLAKRIGAEAVHPGYGFLAENAAFAKACEDAGLVFIGPASGAIALLGDKMEARRTMSAAGIPVVPGGERPLADDDEIASEARRIGFPVMMKAAAGGGGKGMRTVRDASGLAAAAKAARSEARAAFGDDRIYLEKLTVDKAQFAAAVAAEGIPMGAGYGAVATHAYWLQHQCAFGRESHFPWDTLWEGGAEGAGSGRLRTQGDWQAVLQVPGAEAADANHMRMSVHECTGEQEALDTAEALRKVEAAYKV